MGVIGMQAWSKSFLGRFWKHPATLNESWLTVLSVFKKMMMHQGCNELNVDSQMFRILGHKRFAWSSNHAQKDENSRNREFWSFERGIGSYFNNAISLGSIERNIYCWVGLPGDILRETFQRGANLHLQISAKRARCGSTCNCSRLSKRISL